MEGEHQPRTLYILAMSETKVRFVSVSTGDREPIIGQKQSGSVFSFTPKTYSKL